MTTAVDVKKVRQEITHTLRNADILSVTIRGVTTVTENFTATASQVNFILAHVTVKNVRSVTINSGSALKYLRDFSINFTTGVITLVTPSTVNDAVAIQYDYGSGDKIYPDMPRDDLSLTSFPRVGMQVLGINSQPLGLGGQSFISEATITIYAWVPTDKNTSVGSGKGGTDDLSDLITAIRNTLFTNSKAFYTFQWIQPTTVSPIIAGQNNKIIQQSEDYTIKFLVET